MADLEDVLAEAVRSHVPEGRPTFASLVRRRTMRRRRRSGAALVVLVLAGGAVAPLIGRDAGRETLAEAPLPGELVVQVQFDAASYDAQRSEAGILSCRSTRLVSLPKSSPPIFVARVTGAVGQRSTALSCLRALPGATLSVTARDGLEQVVVVSGPPAREAAPLSRCPALDAVITVKSGQEPSASVLLRGTAASRASTVACLRGLGGVVEVGRERPTS